MKAEVIESKKEALKIKFDENDAGILNLIREKLWEDKATQMAGFKITHPQVGHPIFTLKTKGKDAKKVWNEAISKLIKEFEALKGEFKKL